MLRELLQSPAFYLALVIVVILVLGGFKTRVDASVATDVDYGYTLQRISTGKEDPENETKELTDELY